VVDVMPAERALEILDALGPEVAVGGGWAVDALLGEQTRTHADLDLWLPAAGLHDLFRALGALGIDRILPWPGDRPWNFVLHDGASRRVDLHLVEPRGGVLHYGSALAPYLFPRTALDGAGSIGGTAVRCEDPAWAVRFRTGYPPRPQDRGDVPRLCARFGLPLPGGF
jgi:lincosamide nucleotidyltransferase A/C/D/E